MPRWMRVGLAAAWLAGAPFGSVSLGAGECDAGGRDRSGERSLDPHFSRVLHGEGAAVALARHHLAPAHRHPAAVRRRERPVVDSGVRRG
jgi:hypothetical protein